MVLLQDPALQTRFISVQDYHRMIEAEIFGPEERIELLLGQLIPMAAKGSPHSAAVARARDLFDDQLTRQQSADSFARARDLARPLRAGT
ncbi:MAG: hypothetical protein HC771_25425 [Synechococcales cyanobacterium CRU_2_2]|nr:hypothetical protein [Synechococcales cyanobacterium CRU_2_2]